jgi:hypothetical protein
LISVSHESLIEKSSAQSAIRGNSRQIAVAKVWDMYFT